MSKWYGSLNNRLEENKQFVKEIKVGDGVTEYYWSDREPYEVIAVKDQKHITIRRLDAKRIDDRGMSEWQDYEYTSNPEGVTYNLAKRGDYWYAVAEITPDEAKRILDNDDIDGKLWACNLGFNLQEIVEKGKVKRAYFRKNISIGKAEKYYDFSF